MSGIDAFLAAVEQGALDTSLAALYGASDVPLARARLRALLGDARRRFGPGECVVVSAPGRTEIGGNHTDHNGGRVLAAAVQLDLLAVACPRTAARVELRSNGFAEPIVVDVSDLAPRPAEHGRSEALIRGVAAHVAERGFRVGGFCACVDSRIPVGSGLSSSAAFAVLVGQLFNMLYNDARIPPLIRAQAALQAENEYFGKPCGFMDQLACAVQGLLCIDFADSLQPGIMPVARHFEELGLELCIVNAGGSHADLTPEYAAIPKEMRAAARVLGQERCRGITRDQAVAHAVAIRAAAGDRAFLRLLHCIEEDRRAAAMAVALQQGDVAVFLDLIRQSGLSSWRLLQNCQAGSSPAEQPVTVALALTELALAGQGACRVHGGGFAGTIQVVVPRDDWTRMRAFLSTTFGPENVIPVRIRWPGFDLLRLG